MSNLFDQLEKNHPQPCEELPPVPKWWWKYGLQQQLAKGSKESAKIDKSISSPKSKK